MADKLKIPPHDIEAERAVLGSLMIDSNAVNRVADILRAEDFYGKEHGIIYTAMLHLFEKSSPIDILSVSGRLKEQGLLQEVGDDDYLATLVNSVATASHVGHYGKIVKKKKILRDLIETSHNINELGYKEEDDIEMLLDEAEKRIFSISQHSLQQQFFPLKSGLQEAWERIDMLHKGQGALRGIPTGFKGLDNLLAGLQKSDLIVLAARPSFGKTALALDIARNAAVKHKIPVGLFSLEMSAQQLIDRLIAAEAHVDLWKLRTGRLDENSDDFIRIRDALEKLAEAPIFIDDAASNTVLKMRAMARRLQSEHGLGLLVVDYLQLMEGRGKSENRAQEVSEFSRSLKSLARELDVPILAVSQLSRLVEQRHPPIPRLSDLRESGSIEQDADVVMFIYREDKAKQNAEQKNIAEILIEKHRNGPTGKVELYFNPQKTSFTTLEQE